MPGVDPTFLAILNAINLARSEAAERQRRNDERMGRIEDELKEARSEAAERQRRNDERMGRIEDELKETKSDLNHHMVAEDNQIGTILDTLKGYIDKSEAWRAKSDQEMAQNTAVTQDVKNGQNFVRIATAIVKWVGGLALAIGTTWWTVRTIVGGSDIGPGPGP